MNYEAGMPYDQIARSAYEAYAAVTDRKNFRGEPMPEWVDLPPAIRTAWEAAARQVELCLRYPKTPEHRATDRWNGWESPAVLTELHKKAGDGC